MTHSQQESAKKKEGLLLCRPHVDNVCVFVEHQSFVVNKKIIMMSAKRERNWDLMGDENQKQTMTLLLKIDVRVIATKVNESEVEGLFSR